MISEYYVSPREVSLNPRLIISLVIQRTSDNNGGLLIFLQHGNFATDSISWSQNQPPHFPQLRVVHRGVAFKAIHTQKTDDKTFHLRLREFTANAASWTLQERHECVGGVVGRKMIPSIGVKDVSIFAPERRQAMYGVGVDIYSCTGRDIVTTKMIIGDGLAYSHWNRRNVAQGFATYIVQVMQIVGIELGKAFDVVAGSRIKEEGVVLLDLCSETFLNLWVR